LFARGAVPMTKEEVRALTICRARLAPGQVIWDVGAGTGSLTVEAALLSPQGKVFAVEQKEEAVQLIRENCRRFDVTNVSVVLGRAPEALCDLPSPDRVIVGGSGGELPGILAFCAARLNPSGLVVVNAIAPATLTAALAVLGTHPFTELAGIQVQVSRLEQLGKEQFFRAQNAVWILCAQKEVE